MSGKNFARNFSFVDTRKLQCVQLHAVCELPNGIRIFRCLYFLSLIDFTHVHCHTSIMEAVFSAQFIDVSVPHAKKPVFPPIQPFAIYRNVLRQSKRSWISSLIMYTSDATK